MSGTDIFLSYARLDQPTARIFAACLRDEGFSVWWDASLHSGETFDEVIERNLKDSKAVVVLWSPASVASRWVRAEATLADRRNKLVPAMIEPCDRPIIFELTHAAELSDWDGDTTDARWRTFVHDLRRLVGAQREEATSAPERPSKIDETSSLAEPGSSQPSRSASKEVVFAERMRRQAPVPLPPARATIPDESLSSIEVHCLEIESAEMGEGLIVVKSSGMKIGRNPPADIVLSHKSISREHCLMGLASDELLVTDLNSTNGTYIDDVRISRATILPVGSVLRLGQISLRHAIHTQAQAEQRSSVPNTNGDGGLQAGRIAATS